MFHFEYSFHCVVLVVFVCKCVIFVVNFPYSVFSYSNFISNIATKCTLYNWVNIFYQISPKYFVPYCTFLKAKFVSLVQNNLLSFTKLSNNWLSCLASSVWFVRGAVVCLILRHLNRCWAFVIMSYIEEYCDIHQ